MHLTASVRKFRRYIIGTILFVTFLTVYFRESWYLSSGDRAINRMNLCIYPFLPFFIVKGKKNKNKNKN